MKKRSCGVYIARKRRVPIPNKTKLKITILIKLVITSKHIGRLDLRFVLYKDNGVQFQPETRLSQLTDERRTFSPDLTISCRTENTAKKEGHVYMGGLGRLGACSLYQVGRLAQRPGGLSRQMLK